MPWFGKHWAALLGVLLSALYLYLQLRQWKRHGDDFMLLAATLIVTVMLWIVLLVAIGRYALSLKTIRERGRSGSSTIEKSGTLKSLAGQAKWLANDLERIWYEFDKNDRKLIYPLGINVIPDEIREHTDKQLWAFRVQYQSHVGFLKQVDPEFHSAVIDEPLPWNGRDYLTVKRKIEDHADLLRKRAQSLVS